jgi:hypothetical protein
LTFLVCKKNIHFDALQNYAWSAFHAAGVILIIILHFSRGNILSLYFGECRAGHNASDFTDINYSILLAYSYNFCLEQGSSFIFSWEYLRTWSKEYIIPWRGLLLESTQFRSWMSQACTQLSKPEHTCGGADWALDLLAEHIAHTPDMLAARVFTLSAFSVLWFRTFHIHIWQFMSYGVRKKLKLSRKTRHPTSPHDKKGDPLTLRTRGKKKIRDMLDFLVPSK